LIFSAKITRNLKIIVKYELMQLGVW
jgi:hypothetical protein